MGDSLEQRTASKKKGGVNEQPQIEIRRQKTLYDSGQACLEMLGYDPKKIMEKRFHRTANPRPVLGWKNDLAKAYAFSNGQNDDRPTGLERELTFSDLKSITGVKPMGLTRAGNPVSYNEPFMWGCMIKNSDLYEGLTKTAGGSDAPKTTREKIHWVIRHYDAVYCPIKGIMNAEEYQEKYIRIVLYQFRVSIVKNNNSKKSLNVHLR